MAAVISTLDDYISYLNTLYNLSSTPPTSGEEDYTVWTALANLAVNIWEKEANWKELYCKLSAASDGDKTTVAGDNSYALPTDFSYPAVGYVWLGTGSNKTAFKVIRQEQVQLYENDSSAWCYFLMDGSPTLEFNPNYTITGGQTINYTYYKKATKLTTGSSTFEMSDPMFAVYYALSELKKEEGDTTAASIASQKLENMVIENEKVANYQEDSLLNEVEEGFGL